MRRLLLPLVVAAVAVSATVFGSAFARSSEVVTYTDPAGDSGGDVDITRVAVDTDSASELVTFAVTVTGFAPSDLDGRRREIQVYLATDATWRH